MYTAGRSVKRNGIELRRPCKIRETASVVVAEKGG